MAKKNKVRSLVYKTGRTVTEILLDDHGLETVAGRKCICPKCESPHFTIKSDDSLGKCFGPNCGFYISSEGPGEADSKKFQTIVKRMYSDFKQELRSNEHSAVVAREYLTLTRKISPDVVNTAAIGLVPLNYDCYPLFQELLQEYKIKIASSSGQTIEKLEAEQTELEKIIKSLKDIITKASKCIVFFHLDEKHRIGRLRFRKPNSKKFMSWQTPRAAQGVFGLELGETILNADNSDSGLLVVEGEFNVLNLQTLRLKYCESVGIEKTFLYACAVGAASAPDFETVRNACRRPTIIYDHDEHAAGFNLVTKALQHMTVFSATTPNSNDLDDHIKAFGDDPISAMRSIEDLIASRNILARDAESMAIVIRDLRNRDDKQHLINYSVATAILEDLQDFSYFYKANEKSYLFLRDKKELVSVSPKTAACILLIDRYGLNSTETTYSFVVESLRVKILQAGAETAIHRLSFYNEETFTIYLTNFRNQVIKISPDKIETVDNGADKIIFLMDLSHEPIVFDATSINPEHSLIEDHILNKMNVAQGIVGKGAIKVLCLLWMISIFFPQKMVTRAIIAFIGPKGSGKTITLRKIGRLIFGRKFNVTPISTDVKDFDAALTNSSYLAIDNADSKIDYLPDRLAMAATGGSHKRREYYTTNELVEFSIDCFVGISSRTPEFTRDDVTDRLLPIPVERFTKYIPESKLLADIDKNRTELLAEVIYFIQSAVGALKKQSHADDSGVFRIADFGDFALKICREAGCEVEIKKAFKDLVRAQSKMTLESSSLAGLLHAFALKNPDLEVTSADLCTALTKIASEQNTRFEYANNDRGLAQKLPHLKSNLEQIFIVGEKEYAGRVRKWSFKVKSEKSDGGDL